MAGRAAQRHRVALLAILATAPGHRLTRDKLLGLLWPEAASDRARNLLNVAVYNLRSALGEGVIRTEGDDLRFDPDVLPIDLVDFDSALARGDHAGAVALYRGPFLDGFFVADSPEFDQWAAAERADIAARHVGAIEKLAEAAETAGDHAVAADWWRKRSTADPYDSRVALRLMQALDASGNRAGALQHALVHARLLRAEFGTEPPAELTAFAERLRSGGGERASAAPSPGARPIPAGESGSASAAALAAPHDQSGRDPHASLAHLRRRSVRWAVGLATLVVVIGAAAAWAMRPKSAPGAPSIVVLPFLDLSAGRDAAYFSDGLTEEIIGRLATVPGLKVISRTSAMHYKGSTQPLRAIAADLRVNHVLEGSVRREGDRVRISAKLIDATTDEGVWAEQYDRDLRDIVRVQDEIARAVAGALEVRLASSGSRRGTRDPEAYTLYQQGRYLWNLRTAEAHEQALAHFNRAIARDPGYADAWAGIADAEFTAHQIGLTTLPDSIAYARITRAAERALALDERSADAHTSFALVLWSQRNWAGAERELRRAIELNPGHATARSWYSLLLRAMGRDAEAMRESSRALELDPLAVVVQGNHGWHCLMSRDYECATTYYRQAVGIAPNISAWRGLGLAHARERRTPDALTALRRAVTLAPDRGDLLADLAYGQALVGQADSARRTLHRAKTMRPEPFSVGRAHAALGEADSAFAWLEHSSWHWPHRALLDDPGLDPVRKDARFPALQARVQELVGLR